MIENYPEIHLYKQVIQIKLFIDAHFSDNIDFSNIADKTNFSTFHFIRLFKKIYGKTPHQYLIRVRIENAKELLQKEISVTETCYTVGFGNISSFTGLFKRYTNICPSQYKLQFKKRAVTSKFILKQR